MEGFDEGFEIDEGGGIAVVVFGGETLDVIRHMIWNSAWIEEIEDVYFESSNVKHRGMSMAS